MSEWQDIITAPKDGTYVLLFTPSGIVECSYDDFDGWVQSSCRTSYDGHGEVFLIDKPTHWMPLPTPPKEI